MRESIDRLLRDLTLITLALAIALGWALFQVAEGVAQLVAGLLYEIPNENGGFSGGFFPYTPYTAILAWNVGGRILTFGQLVAGLVEFGSVLLVALLVTRYRGRHAISEEDASEVSSSSPTSPPDSFLQDS